MNRRTFLTTTCPRQLGFLSTARNRPLKAPELKKAVNLGMAKIKGNSLTSSRRSRTPVF